MREPMLAMTPLLAAVAPHFMFAAADLAPKTTFAKPAGALVATLSGVEGQCELVLLDRDANELARAAAETGEIDLGALFPAIRAAGRAVRVQAIVAGVPQGAPLVVVPLMPRPAIRTTTDMRPDGVTKFTRVIGWGESLLDPSNEAHKKLAAEWPKADPTPASGFRLERDRDVVFETTAGTIRFALRPDEAPNSARNFVELAASGFYDGTIVHRIVPADRNGLPFVIQGGDPTGTGDGGPGYDLVLANIVAPVLIEHAAVLGAAVRRRPDGGLAGGLVLSGLRDHEVGPVIDRYRVVLDVAPLHATLGDWHCLRFG